MQTASPQSAPVSASPEPVPTQGGFSQGQRRRPVLIGLVVLLVVILLLIGGFIFFSNKQSSELLPMPPAESVEERPVSLPPVSVAQQEVRIFVTETGFDSDEARIKVGGRVTFTNSGSSDHQIASTPHPVHTDYPALNLGVIKPFESKSLTFPTVGTYRFHDHLNPSTAGAIVVVE